MIADPELRERKKGECGSNALCQSWPRRVAFKIRKASPDIGSSDVAMLEQQLGARLPLDYREFLLANNGGRPEGNVEVDIADPDCPSTDIQLFLGIRRMPDTSNIQWHLLETPDRIPGDSLPVALDSGGGLFVLAYRGKDVGQVRFLSNMGNERPLPVANSFDAFIRKVRIVLNE